MSSLSRQVEPAEQVFESCVGLSFGHDQTVGSMLTQPHMRQDRFARTTMTTEAGAVNQAARDARKVREIVVGVDDPRVAAGVDPCRRGGRMPACLATGRDGVRVGGPLRRPLQRSDSRVRRGDRAPRGGGHAQDRGRGPRHDREPAQGTGRGYGGRDWSGAGGAVAHGGAARCGTPRARRTRQRPPGTGRAVLRAARALAVLVVRPPTDTSDRTGARAAS